MNGGLNCLLGIQNYILFKYYKDSWGVTMNSKRNEALDTVPVMISKDLYSKLENGVKHSKKEFKSVEDYVTFLLTEVLRAQQNEGTENYYTSEEDEIKTRLRNLGYI
jgi:uncharacterized circularly permuted ATP-grasp superfamily protein